MSTTTKFQRDIEHIGMSQVEAARFFLRNDRTVRRWASGDLPTPREVRIALWLMRKFNVKPEDVPDDP